MGANLQLRLSVFGYENVVAVRVFDYLFESEELAEVFTVARTDDGWTPEEPARVFAPDSDYLWLVEIAVRGRVELRCSSIRVGGLEDVSAPVDDVRGPVGAVDDDLNVVRDHRDQIGERHT